MYTLKIKWERLEAVTNGDTTIISEEPADEATYFIPADSVKVHGPITSMDQMQAWTQDQFVDCSIKNPRSDSEHTIFQSRLVAVVHGDSYEWYLVSKAWLLGPDGKTIEKIAP